MDNLCDTCSDQHCCARLHSLMLTRDEYEAHFKDYEERLLVKQSNGAYYVTPRDGASCPHWVHDGCAIYLNRPIDCRLFPYTMPEVDKGGDSVKVTLKVNLRCPKNGVPGVLIPEAEARALATEFWRNVTGGELGVIVRREPKFVTQVRSWSKALFH